ncbi:MAG: HlyC/CorC family transporter [Thermoanaerobaculaceae bacterium]|nr:HlyC/CorC family transporter [Thermoanaerobaculaceae bacterium]
MFLKILVVFLCILLNGFFAMAEISIIRSKKSRMERLAKEGNKRAKMAVFLITSPGKFLSSVQIGVTLSSIFAGAVSAAQFSEIIAKILHNFGFSLKLSFSISFVFLGFSVSYLTLVFGELIPKKISLLHPEKIALFISPVMYYLTKIFLPFVFILNLSSEFPLFLVGLNKRKTENVTEEEIIEILEDGLEAGVIERYEHRVISQIFRLSDLPITSIMTPRTKVIAIPKSATTEELRHILSQSNHISYPVFEKSLDNIVGFIHTQEALGEFLKNGKINIDNILRQPLIILESKNSLDALRMFQRKKSHIGIIVDEYGGLKGIVTLRDFLKAIMSEFSNVSSYETPFRRRGDGSWVVSGSVPVETIKEKIGIGLEESQKNLYRTVAGFVLHKLGRIPKEGDFVFCENFKVEVIDMDGKRIDKLLFIPLNRKK